MTNSLETTETPKTPNLPNLAEGMSAVQLLVCQCVAEHMKPAEILQLCAGALANGEVTESWIRHMVSPANRPGKYQAVVAYFRRLAWERREDIKICDPIERAKARQRIIERNEAKNDDLVRLTLQDAEKAYGQVEDADRGPVAVQVNIGQYSALEAAGDGETIEITPGIALPVATADDCGKTANSPPSSDEAAETGQ